ncbi:MAG: metallophosphoesterase, partial [Candidatus Hydrogenedentes bacterium]|nr:metallophosphoesterase [Candidatus Hydrogenedentota bacterium]
MDLLTKTRLFFVTDIHGSERLLLKFLNAAKAYKANVLVYGGDITGKTVTPIMAEDGRWRAEYVGSLRTASTEEELDNLEREIRALGSYPFRTTKNEWDTLRQTEASMEQVFIQAMRTSLRRWMQIAEERLKPIGVRVILNAGNDDLPAVRDILAESDYVIYPEERVVSIDDKHEMPSIGFSNMTPWKCPGDLSEEELLSKLDKVTSGLADPGNSL